MRNSIYLEISQNNQIEEADDKIILHIEHAVNENFESIILLSCDADVVVLLLHYYYHFKTKGLQANLTFYFSFILLHN